jgi:hypothetical protein
MHGSQRTKEKKAVQRTLQLHAHLGEQNLWSENRDPQWGTCISTDFLFR